MTIILRIKYHQLSLNLKDFKNRITCCRSREIKQDWKERIPDCVRAIVIMELFEMDPEVDRNISLESNKNTENNWTILIEIYFEKFHNACPGSPSRNVGSDQQFYAVRIFSIESETMHDRSVTDAATVPLLSTARGRRARARRKSR